MKASNIWSAKTLSWAAIFLPLVGIGCAILATIFLLIFGGIEVKQVGPEDPTAAYLKEGESIVVSEIYAPTYIEALYLILPYSFIMGALIGAALLIIPSARAKRWIMIRSLIALCMGLLACLMFISP